MKKIQETNFCNVFFYANIWVVVLFVFLFEEVEQVDEKSVGNGI
jgi:hypothetical protein